MHMQRRTPREQRTAMIDARLHLLHLTSPALPIGAYAYSQGLEYALESGWLDTDAALQDWLLGLLEHGLGQTELPVLKRCLVAWRGKDEAQLNRWNDFLRAGRESSELLLEDEQLGMALERLLTDLAVPSMAGLAGRPTYVVQFARGCAHWEIDQADALRGFAWSWLENQVSVATKLIPLGQTTAQRLLVALMPSVQRACAVAIHVDDDDLGPGMCGLAFASAAHERQHARLFRS